MADELKRKIGAGSFDPSKTRFHGSELRQALHARPVPPPLPPRVQPDWQSKTRLLPIELLVPEMSSRGRAAAAPLEQTCKLEVAAAPGQRWLTKQRVYAWSACIVLWVTVAAASGAPSPQELGLTPAPAAGEQAVTIHTAVPAAERRRAPSPLTAAETAPVSAAVRPRGPTAPVARPAAAAPPSRAGQPAMARVSQRAALEALAAGDTLAAAQFYAALARQHPDNPAFARAARILTQRREPREASEGGAP